mgnify:CR=1 FL=1
MLDALDGLYVCGGLCVFQAEDGIRDLVRSRGLGDVYKRQAVGRAMVAAALMASHLKEGHMVSLYFRGDGPLELSLIHI